MNDPTLKPNMQQKNKKGIKEFVTASKDLLGSQKSKVLNFKWSRFKQSHIKKP